MKEFVQLTNNPANGTKKKENKNVYIERRHNCKCACTVDAIAQAFFCQDGTPFAVDSVNWANFCIGIWVHRGRAREAEVVERFCPSTWAFHFIHSAMSNCYFCCCSRTNTRFIQSFVLTSTLYMRMRAHAHSLCYFVSCKFILARVFILRWIFNLVLLNIECVCVDERKLERARTRPCIVWVWYS